MKSDKKSFKFNSKVKKTAIGAAIVLLCMAVSFYITGSICFIYAIFGVACPGCGMSRAFESLLKLDFSGAFFYHPLFLLIPVIFGVLAIEKFKYKHKKKTWIIVVMCVFMALFIGLYVYRFITRFPHTEPFLINEKAILQRIISAAGWFGE